MRSCDLFVFVPYFDIVAEQEGGTHITPLVDDLLICAEQSPIPITRIRSVIEVAHGEIFDGA